MIHHKLELFANPQKPFHDQSLPNLNFEVDVVHRGGGKDVCNHDMHFFTNSCMLDKFKALQTHSLTFADGIDLTGLFTMQGGEMGRS